METEVVWLKPASVFDAVGFSWRQWVVVIYCSMCYAQAVVHQMTPTLSQESLWIHWSYLEEHRTTYTNVLAGQAVMRVMCGFLLTPLIDVFGRRKVVMLATLLPLVCAVICMFSVNFTMYAIIRSLIVFIANTSGSTASVYGVELLPLSKRGFLALWFQLIGVTYVMFIVGVKWIFDTWADKEIIWQWLQIVGHVPTILVLPFGLIIFVETPKYLLSSKNNPEGAWKAFDKISGVSKAELNRRLGINNRSGVKFVLSDEENSNEILPIHQRDVDSTSTKPGKQSWISIWAQLFDEKHLILTMAMCFVWFLTAYSHWGLTNYCTLFYKYLGVNVNFTTLMSYAVQLPFHYLTFWVMNSPWGGRIFALKWCSLIGAIIAAGLSVAAATTKNSTALTILSIFTMCWGSLLWGPVYSYSSERYPVCMRGAAMGLFSAIAGTGTVAASYVGGSTINGTRIWLMPMVWSAMRFGVYISSNVLYLEVLNRDIN